jgi:hypothetical protein
MPEINREITIDFEVFCGRCGEGLCRNTEVRYSGVMGMPKLMIDPCEKCKHDFREEGYKDAMGER